MFELINVSVDYGRLRKRERTRLFEGPGLKLTWGARSDSASNEQSACRAVLTGRRFHWDSGWIEKREQNLRIDAETPEGEAIELSLQIRDTYGNESDIYRSVIYNAHTEWRAGWIAPAEDEKGRTIYFRREFSVGKPLESAVLYACGVGYEKLYLNGEALDDTALDPAVTDYSRTCQYLVYPELARHLKQGANCLGALVGEGWRRNVLLQEGKPYAGRPVFTAMLRLAYQNGETEWIVTDDTWQCGRGAHAYNDIFDGEVYDANDSVPDWNQVGFSGFGAACPAEAPGGVMRPMLIPPVIEHHRRDAIASWPLDDDSVMIDFGQNVAGVTRIRLPHMKKGQSIRVSTAEELDEKGGLFTAPLRQALASDTYIASGDERDLEVWQPIFTYHGFRYVCVQGLGAGFDPKHIEAVELHTDLETDSHFRCGDALVTRIHEMCLATERANQHGILTDCPQRDERQGWMNDATVRFEETPYNFDIGRMYPKIIRDVIDEQDQTGAITCTAPYVFGFRPADPVCSGFLVAGLEAYRHQGNVDILAEAFERFAAWENCLLAHSDDYIVNYGYYGDWAGPAYACVMQSIGDGAASLVTPEIFMSTGYSYYNCRLLAEFARVLNRPGDAAHWSEAAERVKCALLKKWYSPGTGRICTGSQGCQAFALWLDIIPKADREKAAKLIHDELVEKEYQFTTGNLCTRYLMDVLTRCGYLEDVWNLLTKQTYPSYGFMLQQEATTVWERFELKKAPDMNSHNHPMYAAVDYWFYAYLCGIRPLKPAYDEFIVEPVFPEKLMSAQATVDTVKGQISVRWFKRYGRLHLHVTVPFGTRARIVFNGKEKVVGSGFFTLSQEMPQEN